MSSSFEAQQARIDALLSETKVEAIPAQKRLLGLARLGMEKPESLTSDETRQICRALVIHYYQMGIS